MKEVIDVSVDIVAKIERNMFSLDIINKSLCDFFNCTAKMDKIDENKYRFSCFYENDDIVLFFMDSSDYRYWDSIILKSKYGYLQSLIFDISKFSDLNKNFKIVLKFLLKLQKLCNSNVLITSTIHDEICYINVESKVIWSNNCGYAKDLIKCSDLILDNITGTIIENH